MSRSNDKVRTGEEIMLATSQIVRVALCGGFTLLAANSIEPIHAQEAAAPANTAEEVTDKPAEGKQEGTSDAPSPAVVPTIPVQADAPPSPGKTRGDATTLDDIVVTASKRSELLSAVPGAVSVLSREKLERIGATNFQDFATYLPGVSSSSRGVGENEIVVRGVAAGNEGQSVSSTVGVYVDELPVGSSSAFAFGIYAIDINVFDLDRIELLSGPQGTLYGASSLGGLLKYVTAPPNRYVRTGSIQSEASSTEDGGLNYSGRAMLNMPFKAPLIDLPLAIRVTGFSENAAGFVDNPSRGLENVDASKTLGGRASMLAEVNPDLSVRLGVMQQEITREGATTVDYDPHTREPVNGEYDQSSRFDEPFLSDFLQYSGVVNWGSDWGDLTSASGWQAMDLSTTSDETDAFGAMFGTGDSVPYKLVFGSELDKATQEIRFASQGLRLFDWQLGGFYTVERARGFVLLTAEGQSGPPILDAQLFTEYREGAGFGEATIHFTDRLDLTLGARYAANKQEFRQFTGGALGTVPSDSSTKESSDKVVTYLINPRYNLNESVMVYGRVASGYRPGGPNFVVPPPQPPTPPTFSPDTVWNYELGTKTAIGSRASIDFDVFYIDWSDIQLLVLQNNLNTIINGGKAKVIGSELASSYLVMAGLTVGGNITYSRATLAEDVPELDAKSGQRLPLSPLFSAALTADYRIHLWECCTGSSGISYRFVGERPSGFDGSTVRPQYWLESYDTWDLRAGVQWQALDLSLTLKNALNEHGGISAYASALQFDPDAPVRVTPIQPRTVGLTLTYRPG